jgi:hypothetical protein
MHHTKIHKGGVYSVQFARDVVAQAEVIKVKTEAGSTRHKQGRYVVRLLEPIGNKPVGTTFEVTSRRVLRNGGAERPNVPHLVIKVRGEFKCPVQDAANMFMALNDQLEILRQFGDAEIVSVDAE